MNTSEFEKAIQEQLPMVQLEEIKYGKHNAVAYGEGVVGCFKVRIFPNK